MQFSVNNKQSTLNTCMLRSLIEVFFFSAGFLALCYFVIKHLHFEHDGADKLTAQPGMSLEIKYLLNKKLPVRLLEVGHQGAGNKALPPGQLRGEAGITVSLVKQQENFSEYVDIQACLAKAATENCLREKWFYASKVGYLWEDKHLDVNFGQTRESL